MAKRCLSKCCHWLKPVAVALSLLFTSHRAMNEAADWLDEQGLEYPLLVQGDAPKAELLNKFVEHGNAILLGTYSFWEGVDVRGDALSLGCD